MWPFGGRSAEVRRKTWPLSMPIWHLSGVDPICLADAACGTAILGASGAGKSTGSGEHLALAYLRAGMGGLVLTAKPDEVDVWRRYCELTGRLNDLKIISPSHPWTFNFLEHEWKSSGLEGGNTENVVAMFSEVLEIIDRSSRGSGRDREAYWINSRQQLLRNSVDTVSLATGRVVLSDLYRFIISLPSSLAQVNDPAWQRESFAYHCLLAADRKPKSASRREDFGLCADYALFLYPTLAQKTRSIVVSTFSSMADVLQRGVLRELYCRDTTITPEETRTQGSIIVMGLDVKSHGHAGLLSQIIMKYAFMKGIEKHISTDATRPVFLWADEAQLFTTSIDYLFQTTARSARVCTVYLTQNLPCFYAALGSGDEGRAAVDSLMGNLQLKIFHANSEPISNQWAAEVIGRRRQYFLSANRSESTDMASLLLDLRDGSQASGGINEVMDYDVAPQVFTRLRQGGLAYDGLIDAIVFQGGRQFKATGKTWLPVTFQQDLHK